ncbi:flagellar basal body L-ring protein FlgH [Thioclava sp. BHET1]|nr:flagellar basal body L-ring protein FlgH [Thioclava sp. BHET1]
MSMTRVCPATVAMALSLVSALSGCAVDKPDKSFFVKPTSFPVQPRRQPDAQNGSIVPPNATGSLYGNQSNWQTGDLVTVNVSFTTTANNSDDGALKKTASFGDEGTKLLGYRPTIALSSNANFAGTGSTSGSNAVTTELTAVVTAIKANGVLALDGHTNVNINGNVTGIEVTGYARPRDIGPNNTLDSSQLADANIQYVGVGDINSAHHVPWLDSTLSKYLPF